MRMSDWSSDVCSSDLLPVDPVAIRVLASPDGKLVATSNIASGTISLFDAETRAPLKTITVSGEAAKRSEEHTSELQSLMRISYAVFCLKKKKTEKNKKTKQN